MRIILFAVLAIVLGIVLSKVCDFILFACIPLEKHISIMFDEYARYKNMSYNYETRDLKRLIKVMQFLQKETQGLKEEKTKKWTAENKEKCARIPQVLEELQGELERRDFFNRNKQS